jgi:hypothetical protein
MVMPPAFSELERLRQGDGACKASLGNTVRPHLKKQHKKYKNARGIAQWENAFLAYTRPCWV